MFFKIILLLFFFYFSRWQVHTLQGIPGFRLVYDWRFPALLPGTNVKIQCTDYWYWLVLIFKYFVLIFVSQSHLKQKRKYSGCCIGVILLWTTNFSFSGLWVVLLSFIYNHEHYNIHVFYFSVMWVFLFSFLVVLLVVLVVSVAVKSMTIYEQFLYHIYVTHNVFVIFRC